MVKCTSYPTNSHCMQKTLYTSIRNAMEKLVVKKPKAKDTEAQQHYAKALDLLDAYLDLVELPPTDSGHYDQEFDTLVGRSARLL